MMRCLVLVFAVACSGSSAKPDYPSLEPPPPDPPAAEIPAAPAPDPAEFAPPPSQPTGDPIAITWAPPAVGERRTRDIAHEALYTSTWDDGGRRQRTVQHFRLHERIAKIDADQIAALEASVEIGEETVDLDGEKHPQTLVSGDYLVEYGADGASIKVSRSGTGFPVGDREREEIQQIYGGDLGRDAPLLAVLKGRRLRVGETVTLTDEENATAGSGTPIDVPINLHLSALADGVATYHFAFLNAQTTGTGDDESTDVRGVKLSFGVEIATGHLRSVTVVDARADSSKSMKSTSRMGEQIVFTY